jgi:hypothetical protein
LTSPACGRGYREIDAHGEQAWFSFMNESEPGSLAVAGRATDLVVLKLHANDGLCWTRRQDFGEGTEFTRHLVAPEGRGVGLGLGTRCWFARGRGRPRNTSWWSSSCDAD